MEKPQSGIAPNEWVEAVNHLADDIEKWVNAAPEWSVTRSDAGHKELPIDAPADMPPFQFVAPTLTIHTPTGRLIFGPRHSSLLDNRGRVDLYAMPSLNRVRLLLSPLTRKWEILTDSGIWLRMPWNRKTFLTIAVDLLGDE